MAQCAACGYTSGWGDAPAEAAGPTSYVARTFLQPQLQKATRWGETATKGDCNLKDFVLFPTAHLRCVPPRRLHTRLAGLPWPQLAAPATKQHVPWLPGCAAHLAGAPRPRRLAASRGIAWAPCLCTAWTPGRRRQRQHRRCGLPAQHLPTHDGLPVGPRAHHGEIGRSLT